MRRAAPWLIGTALVLAAGLVSGITPSQDALVAPFLARGAAGDDVESRMLIARTVQWSFADEVTDEDGEEWSAEGNWLVVELIASAPQTEEGAEIGLAALVLDGQVFHASERPPESLLRSPLRVGVDTTGMLAFELPEGVRSGSGELRLSAQYRMTSLDDVVAIPIDLAKASAERVIEIGRPEVVGAP